MKSRIRVLKMTVLFLFLSAIFAQKSMAQQYVSFQVFYDQLNPYGQWIDYPEYGYVWIPDVENDFMPYGTMGHWIFTEYGWTWVSAYDWGWAPFHYGRWDFDNYYGWFWIPDNEWGPAWVSWRRADGYYGWEPMGPGVSITMSFGRDYDRRHDHWIFVRDRDFDRQDINRFYVKSSQNERIARNSTIINNTYIDNNRQTTYVTGPGRDDIQKGTGHRINSVTIREDNKPGQRLDNENLSIYRPRITRNYDNDRKPAPLKVSARKDLQQQGDKRVMTRKEIINRPSRERTSAPSEINAKETRRTPPNNATKSTRPTTSEQPEIKTEKKNRNEGNIKNNSVTTKKVNTTGKMNNRENKSNSRKPEKTRRR